MGTEVVFRLLIDKLKSLLKGEERSWLKIELQDEFSEIISDSEGLIPLLQEADVRAETEETIRFWMKKVKEVAFEAEDILDDLAPHLWRHESVGVCQKVFSAIPNRIIRHRITVQIRDIHTKFQKLSKGVPVNAIAGTILSSASEDHPIFPPQLEEDDIVGTKTARDELLKWLVEGEERLTVVSVVGMGGLGKTTLVRQVFNSPSIKNHFDCHAWVTVSQNFRKDKLLQSMIQQFDQQVRHHEVDGWTLVQLAEHLRRYLQSKRYVIVLDDVWSIDLWEGIKYMLPETRFGSRVIITTRNYEVAMSTYGHVYNLQLLTSEEAWSLFCKKAFPPDAKCPQELKKSSGYVVTRCGGLPLAIAVMGGFFSTKRGLSEWEPFIHNLGSKLESNPYFTTLIRVIKLSYNALPYNLKFCFLYMGIFPEDVPIRITRLIRLWIAEGFVQAMEGKTREEVALSYLNELVGRSLVRVSEFHDDGRLGSCQIHDLIRDVILSVVREESFFNRYGEKDMNFYRRVIRRLYIDDNFAGGLMLKRSHHNLHLRSLLVFGKERIFESVLALMGIHKFTFLKVLDLEGTPVKRLPSEIGNLFHLRYLSLRNTMITSLPKSLGKLVNIETLDLKGTGISVLPIEILKLKFLCHLIVGCYGMNGVSVPKGIGKLSALQTLTCIDVAGELAAISELGNLMQLMKLCIANLKSEDGRTLCSSIEKMNRLISFKAMSKDDNQSLDLPAISPTPRLQRIHLNGRLENLPDWIASLHDLVKMSLFGSRLSDDPLKILQSLPNLVVLTLEAAYDGKELCCQAKGLPKLKVLKLARLDGLKLMRVEKGAMPCLQKLHLEECKMLEKVPFGIEHLPCLKELCLMKMSDALIKTIASDGEEDHRKIEHIPLVRTKSISTPAGE